MHTNQTQAIQSRMPITERIRRVGLLVPASDQVSEADFHTYLPPAVVFHTARLRQAPNSGIGTAKNYSDLIESAPLAARSVALALPELLVYSCTSASFFKGYGWDKELSQLLEAETGIPAITTSTAVIEALKALRANNIFMVTPYPSAVNELEVEFLKANGFAVTGVLSFHCTRGSEVGAIKELAVVEAVLAKREALNQADAVFISCTGLRAIGAVEMLETDLDMPVVTSNSASIWLALTKLGVDSRSVAAGILYRPNAVPEAD